MPFLTKPDGAREWTRNSSHLSMFTDLRAKSRLSKIESLPVFIPSPRISFDPSLAVSVSPHSSFHYVPGTHGPGRPGQNTDKRTSTIRPVTPITISEDVEQDLSAPLTDSNIVPVEDVRYGDVARSPLFKNRISTVSQYPVLVNGPPPVDVRRVPQRRPVSIASASASGLYLAVAQLPGSEPFELEPPSQDILSKNSGVPTQHYPATTSYDQDQECSVYHTAQAVRVQRAGIQSNGAPSIHRVSIVSTERFPQRYRTLSGESRNESRPGMMNISRTWPDQDMPTSAWSNSEATASASESTRPPPPPPKDFGYLKRKQAPNRLRRQYSSTPHLPSYATQPSAMERTGIIKERSGPTDEKQHRGWFGGIFRNHTWSPRSPRRLFPPTSERGSGANYHASGRKSSSNRGADMLAAVARLATRALPKPTMLKSYS
jgi:hypothetical protein